MSELTYVDPNRREGGGDLSAYGDGDVADAVGSSSDANALLTNPEVALLPPYPHPFPTPPTPIPLNPP